MAYREDLRIRVVEFVRNGGSKAEAQGLFRVSEWCVYDWLKRGENLTPDKPGAKEPRKVNLAKLRKLVEEKPDAYLDELAKDLNVGKTAVWRGCQKLG